VIAPVPQELAERIWGAFGNDETDFGAGFPEPRVVIDDDDEDGPPGRLLAIVGLALAVAAAIFLVLFLPGRPGDREQRPAGSTTVPTVSNWRSIFLAVSHTAHGSDGRAAGVGAIADPSSCPHREMGACFDPFPAGRYTFHTFRPQITLTVGKGWTNEAALSDLTGIYWADHSRSGGISIAVDGAVGEVDPANPCFPRPVPGVAATASAIVAWFRANPDLIVTNVRESLLGELPGTTFDVRPRPGLGRPTCKTGLHGVYMLVPPRPSGGWGLVLRAGDRARMTIAATHAGGTVAVIVEATEAAFGTFASQARHVVDSISFEPCALDAPGAQPCEPSPPPVEAP
jgi:hypothetical protein